MKKQIVVDIKDLRRAHWYKKRDFNSQHAANMLGLPLEQVNLMYSTSVPREKKEGTITVSFFGPER